MDRKEYLKEYYKKYKENRGIKRFSISLEMDSYKVLKERCAKLGFLSMNDYITSLIEKKEHKWLEPKEEEILKSFITVIRGIGTNINQLAKRSNTIEQGIEDREVFTLLSNLEAEFKNYILKRNNK